jgi:predicted RNase H-like nuclease (RuvC/YqgF family)
MLGFMRWFTPPSAASDAALSQLHNEIERLKQQHQLEHSLWQSATSLLTAKHQLEVEQLQAELQMARSTILHLRNEGVPTVPPEIEAAIQHRWSDVPIAQQQVRSMAIHLMRQKVPPQDIARMVDEYGETIN